VVLTACHPTPRDDLDSGDHEQGLSYRRSANPDMNWSHLPSPKGSTLHRRMTVAYVSNRKVLTLNLIVNVQENSMKLMKLLVGVAEVG